MKKIFAILAAAVAAFSLVSCNKEPIERPSTGLSLNITVTEMGGIATKAVKTSWVNGDKINIWYDANNGRNPDLVIKFDGSTWSRDNSAAVSGNAPSASGTLNAVYVGSNNLAEFDNYIDGGTFSYRTAKNGMVDDTNYPARPSLLSYVSATPYTCGSAVLTATLSAWQFGPNNTQIVITGLPAGTWALKCNELLANSGFYLRDSQVFIGNNLRNKYVLPVENPDGKAYYMRTFIGGSTDFVFTLFKVEDGTRLTYEVSGKALDTSMNKLNAITIPFSKFAGED